MQFVKMLAQSLASLLVAASSIYGASTTAKAEISYQSVPASDVQIKPYQGIDILEGRPRAQCIQNKSPEWPQEDTEYVDRDVRFLTEETVFGRSAGNQSSISADLGKQGMTLAGAIGVASDTTSSAYSLSGIISYQAIAKAQIVDTENLILTQSAREALDKGPYEFRVLCGDALVVGKRRGHVWSARFVKHYRDRKYQEQDRRSLAGSYGSLSAGASNTSATESVFASTSIEAQILSRSTHSGPISLDFKSTLQWIQNAPLERSKPTTVAWYYVHYDEIPSLAGADPIRNLQSKEFVREWRHFLNLVKAQASYTYIHNDQRLFAGQPRENLRAYLGLLDLEIAESVDWMKRCYSASSSGKFNQKKSCSERLRLTIIDPPPLPSEDDWIVAGTMNQGEYGFFNHEGVFSGTTACRSREIRVSAPFDYPEGFHVEYRGKWIPGASMRDTFNPLIAIDDVQALEAKWSLASERRFRIPNGRGAYVAFVDGCGMFGDNDFAWTPESDQSKVRLVGALLPILPDALHLYFDLSP